MTQFLDTNILLYSISTAPMEANKRGVAINLLDRTDNAISVQVLQEFYVQTTHASRPDALPPDVAVGLIRTWLRFPVQDIGIGVTAHALDIKDRYQLSYWDAAIVAAAHASGCGLLLTEDLSAGLTIDGVRIENPFQ